MKARWIVALALALWWFGAAPAALGFHDALPAAVVQETHPHDGDPDEPTHFSDGCFPVPFVDEEVGSRGVWEASGDALSSLLVSSASAFVPVENLPEPVELIVGPELDNAGLMFLGQMHSEGASRFAEAMRRKMGSGVVGDLAMYTRFHLDLYTVCEEENCSNGRSIILDRRYCLRNLRGDSTIC